MTRDNIDKALGLNDDGTEPPGKEVSVEVMPHSTDVTVIKPEDDFEYARQNIRALVDDAMENIKDLHNVALQSESPRAYEVYAKTIDTLVSANEKLMTVAVKKAEAEAAKPSAPSIVTNNQQNIFVGSAADILKSLRPQEQD